MERDPEKERQKLRKNITEKRWQMGGLNKQGEEKNRVPDTAHDCPILRIGVMHEQPVSERENLWTGSFSLSSTVCPCTTKPPSSLFRLDNAEEKCYLIGANSVVGR